MIRIESLDLRNFRSHQSTELNFDSFNFIIGPNGAGKTSILDAISIAMIGRTPTVANRPDALGGLVRDGSDGYNIFIKTNLGNRRVIFDGSRTWKEGDMDAPDRLYTTAKFLFSPGAFFDGSATARHAAVAELIGIDMPKCRQAIMAKVRELDLPAVYRDTCDVSTQEAMKTLINKLKDERNEVRKKADQFRMFSKIEAKPIDLTKAIKWKCEVEAWDENVKALRDILATCDNDTVRKANVKYEQIQSEIDNLSKQYALTQGARVYAEHRKCPLRMICPNAVADWQKVEQDSKAMEIEMQVKLEKLKAERGQLEELRVNAANLDVWRTALADLEGRAAEMQKMRDAYEAECISAGQAEDILDKKGLYEKSSALHEKLDALVKFLERDIIPKFGLVEKFNTLLAAGPYQIRYDNGEIYWNGRLYEFCSPSQQFRCKISLAEVIGQDVGFVVVDGFEILDAQGKAENLKVLRRLRDEGFQVFVAGSYTQPFKDIPINPVQGMQMIWLELQDGVSKVTVIK